MKPTRFGSLIAAVALWFAATGALAAPSPLVLDTFDTNQGDPLGDPSGIGWNPTPAQLGTLEIPGPGGTVFSDGSLTFGGAPFFWGVDSPGATNLVAAGDSEIADSRTIIGAASANPSNEFLDVTVDDLNNGKLVISSGAQMLTEVEMIWTDFVGGSVDLSSYLDAALAIPFADHDVAVFMGISDGTNGAFSGGVLPDGSAPTLLTIPLDGFATAGIDLSQVTDIRLYFNLFVPATDLEVDFVTFIPEPSTLLLVGSLVAMGGFSIRRRKA